MWLERISGSTPQVIDLAAAKQHLRLLETDFDSEVTSAIEAASAYLDVDEDGFGGLGFPLVGQVWEVVLGGFSGAALRLPFTRITGISQITYFDADGAAQTLATGTYHLARDGRRFMVCLASGATWPDTAERPDAVRIRFAAGWTDVAAVPAPIKQAARLLVSDFFENRNAVDRDTIGVSADVRSAVASLTNRYRAFAG